MKLHLDKPTVAYYRLTLFPEPKPGQVWNYNARVEASFAFIPGGDPKEIKFGWALCSAKDRFVRKTGRELALKRLQETPKSLTLDDSNFVHKHQLMMTALSVLLDSGLLNRKEAAILR